MLNRWRLDTEGVILSTLFYERGEDAAKNDGRVSAPNTPTRNSIIPIDDAPPIVLIDDQMDTLLRVEYEESKQESIPMGLLDK